MRKLFSLFKILISSTYGISSIKYKISKKKTEMLKRIALFIVIVISLFPMLFGYIAYMNASYDSLSMLGQPGAIITLGAVASSMIVIFFGFFYIVSTFYFSNDTEYLVTLPLKPSQILGAKFGVVLVSEYITELPLVLPPVIIYGIKSGAGLLYYVYSLIGILVIPVIPLCLAAIAAVIVMRVTNIGRKRDLFRIIGGIATVFIMLGVQTYIQKTAVSGDPEQLRSVLFSENGLINMVARNFPPAAWISIALIEYENTKGLIYFLIFITSSLLFLIAFGYLGEKLFLGGYLGAQETASKGRKLDEGQFAREVGTKGKIAAIFWREYRILNRVPIFFLNCVLPVILVPAIFVMMFITTGNELMDQLVILTGTEEGLFIATVVLCGIGAFTGAASMIAPTSISREGAQFFISKYIPVSPRQQILGKIAHAVTIVEAGNVLAIATIGILLKIPVVNIIISVVISTLIIISVIEIGLIIDLFRPMLEWDNPQKAVKQNLNGVISMFFNALWVGVVLFLTARFITNGLLAYALLIGVFLAASGGLFIALMSYAAKRYAEIEP